MRGLLESESPVEVAEEVSPEPEGEGTGGRSELVPVDPESIVPEEVGTTIVLLGVGTVTVGAGEEEHEERRIIGIMMQMIREEERDIGRKR